MRVIRCNNGHFYDGDAYQECPHCDHNDVAIEKKHKGLFGIKKGNYKNDKKNVAERIQPDIDEIDKTVMLSEDSGETVLLSNKENGDTQFEGDKDKFHQQISNIGNSSQHAFSLVHKSSSSYKVAEREQDVCESVVERSVQSDDDDVKTVYFAANSATQASVVNSNNAPVAGWLLGLNGASMGQSYSIKYGKNYIGRGQDMDIVLSDAMVSRNKHALIVYDPKTRQFVVLPGDAKELFYLNDQLVLTSITMKDKDILLLGNTKLMLKSCCNDEFCWEDYM